MITDTTVLKSLGHIEGGHRSETSSRDQQQRYSSVVASTGAARIRVENTDEYNSQEREESPRSFGPKACESFQGMRK